MGVVKRRESGAYVRQPGLWKWEALGFSFPHPGLPDIRPWFLAAEDSRPAFAFRGVSCTELPAVLYYFVIISTVPREPEGI